MKKLVLILVMMVIGCMGFAEDTAEKKDPAPSTVQNSGDMPCNEVPKVADEQRKPKNISLPDPDKFKLDFGDKTQKQ